MENRIRTSVAYAFVVILALVIPWGVNGINLRASQEDDPIEANNLRILTFGTSMTWGAGLQESERHEQAYPWLLSSDATNLAIRASGPAYPSVCTESMVGDDEIYDVIILEYYMRVTQGLVTLAQRLRQRFPDATIIILRLWNPMHIGLRKNNLSIKEWYLSKNVDGSLHHARFRAELLKMPNRSFQFKPYAEQDQVQREAVKAVGGHLVKLYHPHDPRESIARYAHWFSEDWHHLSKAGHAAVAHQIREKLKSIQPQRSDNLGTWGAGDSCQNFYSTGDCTLPHSPEVTLTMFNKKSLKYALELRSSTGGTIKVNNPFDGPRELYLAFMATGPPPSIYPKVRVSFPGHPEIAPTELDPTSYIDDGHPVHISKLGFAGVIPPGDTVLLLQPLEESGVPFRLTGLSITGGLDAEAFSSNGGQNTW